MKKKLATRTLQYHSSWSCESFWHSVLTFVSIDVHLYHCWNLTQDWAVSKWSPWYTFVQVLKACYWVILNPCGVRPTHPAGQHPEVPSVITFPETQWLQPVFFVEHTQLWRMVVSQVQFQGTWTTQHRFRSGSRLIVQECLKFYLQNLAWYICRGCEEPFPTPLSI